MPISHPDGVIRLYFVPPKGHPAPAAVGRANRRDAAASRRQLQRLLGHVWGLSSDQLKLAVNAHGKPSLADPALRRHLSFSKADAAGALLVGTAAGSPLGVDLEPQRAIAERDLIIDGYFHPDEAAAIRSQPSDRQDDAFLRIWVRKEALLKAVGLGLSVDLDSFTVASPDGEVRMEGTPHDEPRGWWCTDLDLPKPWVGAVCTDQPDMSLEYRPLALDGLDAVSDVGSKAAQ